jgi:hypothetical protein
LATLATGSHIPAPNALGIALRPLPSPAGSKLSRRKAAQAASSDGLRLRLVVGMRGNAVCEKGGELDQRLFAWLLCT